MGRGHSVLRAVAAGALTLTLGLLAGCSGADQGTNTDPDLVDAKALPKVGLCRDLTPEDVALPANATKAVPCSGPHTAETYLSAELPAELRKTAYDSAAMATHAYRTCSAGFAEFVGADESLVLRTTVSWAWFRPSEKAWEDGARWMRCDIVGGNTASTRYRRLPESSRGLLAGRPAEKWLICSRGPSVSAGEKVPCSAPHDWRAVTTVKLGEETDPYPGDAVMESRSRSFCAESVKAWLNYPADFEYGFTYFHGAEWKAGNRRSVCWARSDQ